MQIPSREGTKVSDEIIEKVLASIAKIKSISPENIRLDSTFEELKMDSLAGLDLFFDLEEIFDLTIPDETARSLRTVRGIVEEIEKLLANQRASLSTQNQ
jgi:acyl carrier protein